VKSTTTHLIFAGVVTLVIAAIFLHYMPPNPSWWISWSMILILLILFQTIFWALGILTSRGKKGSARSMYYGETRLADSLH